jgi:uncharacterized protein YdaU (DUF1376 family)
MSKDPAVLWYPNDYLGGTLGMTFEEKGAYVELLMMQFNRGHMTDHMINHMLGHNADKLWAVMKDKFTQDENGYWYNERMEIEILRRQKYVKSRTNNRLGKEKSPEKSPEKTENQLNEKHMITHMSDHVNNHMIVHMENENENINRIEIKGENKRVEGIKERGVGREKKGDEKKREGAKGPDLIDRLIGEFENAYMHVRGDPYVVTNRGKDRDMMGKLLALYNKRNPDGDTETAIESLRSFFLLACDISDPWLYDNMNIGTLYSQINKITIILKNGGKQQKRQKSGISDGFRRWLHEGLHSPEVNGSMSASEVHP